MKIGSSSFVSERTGKFTSFYRIITRIGEGGYGQVYKVQHKKTNVHTADTDTPRRLVSLRFVCVQSRRNCLLSSK